MPAGALGARAGFTRAPRARTGSTWCTLCTAVRYFVESQYAPVHGGAVPAAVLMLPTIDG